MTRRFSVVLSCFLCLLISSLVQANDYFNLGVRSGDPTDSGVVLWTRLNPDKCTAGLTVAYQISKDPSFASYDAGDVCNVIPERDYTVHVCLDGVLEPDMTYYYRFCYDGQHFSRTGQTRTLPARDAVRPFNMAVLTCQDFSTGFFNVHRILADKLRSGEIDLVFFDGDFIYEYAKYDSKEAKILRDSLVLPSGHPSAMTAEDFRYIYHAYLADEHLQECLAAGACMPAWDDHEVADNLFWDRKHDAAGIPGDRYKHLSPAAKTTLMLDARKAWATYTPTRSRINWEATHPHDFITMYRPARLGKMADFFITDSRSYRDG